MGRKRTARCACAGNPNREYVTMWNTITKRRVGGTAAPCKDELEEYMRRNAHIEVYKGQDGGMSRRQRERAKEKRRREREKQLRRKQKHAFGGKKLHKGEQVCDVRRVDDGLDAAFQQTGDEHENLRIDGDVPAVPHSTDTDPLDLGDEPNMDGEPAEESKEGSESGKESTSATATATATPEQNVRLAEPNAYIRLADFMWAQEAAEARLARARETGAMATVPGYLRGFFGPEDRSWCGRTSADLDEGEREFAQEILELVEVGRRGDIVWGV